MEKNEKSYNDLMADAYYRKIADEIAERKRIAEIQEDNEWRDQMG